MHPAATFRVDEKTEALAFIAAHPFATLAVNGADGPVTALVPLVIDSSGQNLLGHVARTNSFWQAAQMSEHKAVAVFQGADAYVSSSSYPSKADHGRVVPTWNYMAVEIRGNIKVETKSEAMLPFLTALTDKMESHRDLPWEVSDAPEDYIAKLSRAIVGFSLKIDEITYVRKLSQNKSEADKQGVITSLEMSENHQDRLVAHAMKQES